MPQPSVPVEDDWRSTVFKYRGLLLVPVALVLVIFGAPSIRSAAIGIGIALIGELLRIWAVGFSGETTRSDVVTAPELVTAGPYSFIRNPLYVGNAIIALGFWLAFSGNVSMLASFSMFAVIAILVVGVYGAIVPLEETYLRQTFGSAYDAYCRSVARVIPLGAPIPREDQRGRWRSSVILRSESITLAYFALMVIAVIVKLWAAR